MGNNEIGGRTAAKQRAKQQKTTGFSPLFSEPDAFNLTFLIDPPSP